MAKTRSKKNDSAANLGFEAKLWLAADKLRKRILKKHGYPSDLQDEATKTALAPAELLSAPWA